MRWEDQLEKGSEEAEGGSFDATVTLSIAISLKRIANAMEKDQQAKRTINEMYGKFAVRRDKEGY